MFFRGHHVLISYPSTIDAFWVIHRDPSAVADEWPDVMLCAEKKPSKICNSMVSYGYNCNLHSKVRLYIWKTFKQL